jgi:hypothetical protein
VKKGWERWRCTDGRKARRPARRRVEVRLESRYADDLSRPVTP